jgi:GNAT superfamily N-acetyltransferase
MPQPTDPGGSARVGWWQCRALRADGAPDWFAVVWSADQADGVRLELPAAEAADLVGDNAVCIAHYDDLAEVSRLVVTPHGAPQAPAMWFAEFDEPHEAPPAVNLVAFSGHGIEAGSLLDAEQLRSLPVASSDQLGAMRWYPGTGEVDQVYVSPRMRRRTIGGALVAATSALSLARGWPRLWGDGQRTAMGDRWRNASPWAHRAAELTHLAPPMTPFEDR